MKTIFFKLLLVFVTASFFSCEDVYVKPTKISYQQQVIDSTLASDHEIEEFIAPYKEKIEKEMKTVLSNAPKAMYKTDSKYNTAIGNMMADAVLEGTNPIFEAQHNLTIDGVLLNFGGIRSGIDKGDVTVRTAFDIMPFENEIIIVELPYESIQEMIRYLMSKRVAHPIAGIQLELNHNYSLKEAKVGSVDVKLTDKKDNHFYIATTDYLLHGGDEMNFFANNKKVYQTNYKLRNLLIDYFENNKELINEQDNRFTVGK